MISRILGAIFFTSLWASPILPARSQLIPDATLGTENSSVVPINSLQDVIEGGAIRGANLFHSFQEFNVGENRSLYFANPGAIANILTRVTGGNTSDILGTLGVLGDANLWLINPNGIYFGANATLDLRGSFTATTAEGVWLGNTGYFSATDPSGSQLLSIEPGALFTNALAAQQATITNRGNLSIGGDFTLAGGNLDLTGEIEAGRDLNLQALEILKIRDRADAPFIAKAGGELLLQGNQNIDIFALNHPNSGLFSGGDLILKSRNPVLGDIHYYSGGNFTILNPDTNTLEGLESPWDPVIRAAGDVSMASYVGASLHILAGGSVNITGDISITGVDTTDGLQETVTLSDGTKLSIDGKTVPTLDIRAGTINFGTTATTCGGCVSLSAGSSPTSANINIGGNVDFFGTGSGGLVFLSNQYFANPALGNGSISVNSFDTGDFTGAGDVIIDTPGNLTVSGLISTIPASGISGDVTLLAGNTIQFTGLTSPNGFDIGINISNTSPTFGKAGAIRIETGNLELLNGARFQASSLGRETDGNIVITARDTVRFQGEDSQGFFGSGIDRAALDENAGDVIINARNIEILDGAFIVSNVSGAGNAGNIILSASNTIRFQGVGSLGNVSGISTGVETDATGQGGDITINTRNLEVLDGGRILAGTQGTGNAGNVTIAASDTIVFRGADNTGFNISSIQTTSEATGKAGNIAIAAKIFNLDGGRIETTAFAEGNGGAIAIVAEEATLTNDATIDSSTIGQGNAGDIVANIQQLELDSAFIAALSQGEGLAGDINMNGTNLTLRNSSQITAVTDTVDGGNINIDLSEVLLLRTGSFILTDSGTFGVTGGGNGGNITINAAFVVAVPGENSDITANAFQGNGGNITINANAIYGLEFRNSRTIFSDITASSEFGLNGALVFNPLSFPSEQGLNELPDSLVDAESIIGRDACALEDGRIAGGSSFTVTGRGGIPTSPNDSLTNSPYVPEWSSRRENVPSSAVILRETPIADRDTAIRPVQGWYVAADGTVHLTARASNPLFNAPTLSHPDCSDFSV